MFKRFSFDSWFAPKWRPITGLAGASERAGFYWLLAFPNKVRRLRSGALFSPVIVYRTRCRRQRLSLSLRLTNSSSLGFPPAFRQRSFARHRASGDFLAFSPLRVSSSCPKTEITTDRGKFRRRDNKPPREFFLFCEWVEPAR